MMDNLPKEENDQNPTSSQTQGEVYQADDAYSAQLTPETPPQPSYQDQSQVPPPPSGPSAGYENVPPPPYEERSKLKIFAVIGLILLFLVILFLGVRFLLTRVDKTAKSAALTYWGLWEDPQVVQPLIDEFQKANPNIKITYTKQNPKEYRERLQAALGRGEGPDIFRFHNTWTDMMLADLSPLPQTIYSPADFDKTFYPVVKDDVQRGGNYYGIPLEIDGLVLLYNEDIVKAAGVTQIPQNWEDFQNLAQNLTVKDSNGTIQTAGVALGSADNIAHFSDILALMFLQNGTNLKDPQGQCADPTITTCATDTLVFYRRFANPPGNTWDDNLDNSLISFAGGKVAMIFAPTWQIFTIKQLNPDLNLKVAQVPQLPGINIHWATYWIEGVSKRSKSQEAAWQFLKFLSSKESLTKLYTQEAKTRFFGEPYSRVDLGETLAQDPYLAPLIAEAPTMKSFPLASNTQDNGINDQMIKYLLDSVNSMKEGGSAEGALGTIASGFNQILQKFGVLAAPPTASQ